MTNGQVSESEVSRSEVILTDRQTDLLWFYSLMNKGQVSDSEVSRSEVIMTDRQTCYGSTA